MRKYDTSCSYEKKLGEGPLFLNWGPVKSKKMRHPADVWNETLDSLGGWKGIGIIAVILFIFTQIVETIVPMRHTYNGNYARQMKGKRKGEWLNALTWCMLWGSRTHVRGSHRDLFWVKTTKLQISLLACFHVGIRRGAAKNHIKYVWG